MCSGSYRQQTDYVFIRKLVLLQNFNPRICRSNCFAELVMFQQQYRNVVIGQGIDNSPLPDEHGFVVLNA